MKNAPLFLAFVASAFSWAAQAAPWVTTEIACTPAASSGAGPFRVLYETVNGHEILVAEEAGSSMDVLKATQFDYTLGVTLSRFDHGVDCRECWDKWPHFLLELKLNPNDYAQSTLVAAHDMSASKAYDPSILNSDKAEKWDVSCVVRPSP